MSREGESASSTVIINEDGPAHEAKAQSTAGPKGPTASLKGLAAAVKKTPSRRGLAVLDFVVRLFAIGGAVAAAVLMATDDETLPFFTQVYQFFAYYRDFDALTFFVIGMSIVAGYLVMSLVFSIVSIVRPRLGGLRLLLLVLDTANVALATAAASAAAAVVYLAHTGNQSANWVAMCIQFNDFCQRSSGAVVSSFVAVALLVVLVVLSALMLRRP